MIDDELTPGEIELLIGGLSDDIALVWALIHLGLRSNPPAEKGPPSNDLLALAFASFGRLVSGGLMSIGSLQPVPGGQRDPRGVWPAPTMHVAQAMDDVRRDVEKACAGASSFVDWAFSCWLENTRAGDVIARRALAARGDTRPRRVRLHDSRPP